MRYIIGALFAFVVAFAGNAQDTRLSTLIVFRHAEKSDDGSKDPDLSEVGSKRATMLAEMFRNTEIAAIFSTQYRRTMNTISPLCSLKNLQVTIYDPAKSGYVDDLMNLYPGKTVVICGHSNTIPPLINALTRTSSIAAIPDSAFDDVFIVTFDEKKNAGVTRLTVRP
jgi:2,3-bisphosphoglycerate-dependent phosphoglycerate mutase